ncbi:hypothetical protein Gasu2_18460 [Galdieria sulphuraria]|nr:hypothetical protein Gasu2_18460 [Galdieria sulphuraria]
MIDFWLLCFVFLVFQCCLVSGFTYSKACRWIVPFNETVSYWKSTGTGKTIESTIQNSLFSVEKAKLCEQHSLEKLAECLFEDPDIVFWTRFLSGVQLEKFYLLLTDWFEKNSQCPKLFVIHVQHGLGNRLRALASALAYVELIPHIPILIWECDHHMGAKWEDLFEDLSNVVISPVEDESLLKNPFAIAVILYICYTLFKAQLIEFQSERQKALEFNVVVVTDFKNLKTALQPKKGNSQQPLGKLLRDSHLIYEAMSNYLKAQFLLDED